MHEWLYCSSQEDFIYNNGEIHDLKRLGEDLALLLSSKDTADIIFVVGKEKTQFHLHSLILACRWVKIQIILISQYV